MNSPSSQKSELSDWLPARALVVVARIRITKIPCFILIICAPAHISAYYRAIDVEFFTGRQNHNTGTAMIPEAEQTRWASQEAAIKAEINQAKNTFELVRMAMPSYGSTPSMRKWKRPARYKPVVRRAVTLH